MPTLYTLQESNVRKTFLLITLFLIFIIALGWLFSYVFDNSLILIAAVIFSVVTSFSSYWYSDKLILSMVKAKPIEKKDNPELYRIVENLCITAGLPLPKIYIINEKQPNAFATGRDPKHGVVAVTEGLLQKLERSEIEGVIAHELSHIKNRDTLLQTVVVVLVGIVAIASDWLLRSTIWQGYRRKKEQGPWIMFLALISAILAPLIATIIRLAISRKREFLADASGALLTRYPEGLARALEKIAADDTPMRTAKTATAHLYIENPFKGSKKVDWFTRLFMTHPPVEERIKALRGMKI